MEPRPLVKLIREVGEAGATVVLNVAVTDPAAFMATAQVPVPEHPEPDQPANVDPPDAAAVRVTTVPLLKLAEHVEGQVIPAGDDVTVPLPVPFSVTVSV